jgi:hypothetical protein
VSRHLRLLTFIAVASFAITSLTACSGPADPVDTPDVGTEPDVVDVEQDTGGDAGQDVAPDVDDNTCAYQLDCGQGRICFHGECIEAPTCNRTSDWQSCINKLSEIDETFGRRGYCDGSHCAVACLLDEECPDAHLCTNNGVCIPSGANVTGEHPGGGERTALRAGVSNVLMHFPIGLSMGGYGSRAAFNNGRYVETLRASHGKMHGVYARAIAVDNGERELIMMRVPIILTSMAVHEAVARRLQEATGKDWRDSLIMSATHTHSGPTRYWNVPRDTQIPMGTMGSDEYHEVVFNWMVDTLTEAALEARADLKPSRMGWTIVEAYDTDDMIASDRWGETPPFDDNRLLMIRVDDAEGVPQGVIVSFGSHGTSNSSDLFTDDVFYGIERKLEDALGERFDRFVPVLYFNQNGGNMSPRGDRRGHRGPQGYEALGEFFVERALEPLLDIETTETWELSAHTHRFPITYELVGYEPGEWRHNSQGDYHYGALSCVGNKGGDSWHTHAEIEDLTACMGVPFLAYHRPVTILSRSQITALKLNELTVVTLPGEPAMEVGWQVLRELRDRYGLDPMTSFTWGYAQDHLLYIVPTNLRGELPPFPGISTPMAPDDYPDFAFSYLQGGYEADMSPWGLRFGDYIVARAAEAAGLMLGEPVEVAVPGALPKEFAPTGQAEFPIDLTAPGRAGTITVDVPAQVKRLQAVELAWIGGDPGAEMPQAPRVVLERQQGQNFVEVLRPNRRPYDNREMAMITRLRKDGSDYEWVIYWEELQDFPAGNYRFRIQGHYQESEGAAGRKPYEATSRVFALVPTDGIEVSEVSLQATSLSARVSYAPAQRFEVRRTAGDMAAVSGSYRMRHLEVGTGLPVPVDGLDPAQVMLRISDGQGVLATLTGADVTSSRETRNVEGRDIPTTRLQGSFDALASGAYTVEVQVTDPHGNQGHGTFELTIP